jgi:hypothetical protein
VVLKPRSHLDRPAESWVRREWLTELAMLLAPEVVSGLPISLPLLRGRRTRRALRETIPELFSGDPSVAFGIKGAEFALGELGRFLLVDLAILFCLSCKEAIDAIVFFRLLWVLGLLCSCLVRLRLLLRCCLFRLLLPLDLFAQAAFAVAKTMERAEVMLRYFIIHFLCVDCTLLARRGTRISLYLTGNGAAMTAITFLIGARNASRLVGYLAGRP